MPTIIDTLHLHELLVTTIIDTLHQHYKYSPFTSYIFYFIIMSGFVVFVFSPHFTCAPKQSWSLLSTALSKYRATKNLKTTGMKSTMKSLLWFLFALIVLTFLPSFPISKKLNYYSFARYSRSYLAFFWTHPSLEKLLAFNRFSVWSAFGQVWVNCWWFYSCYSQTHY